MNPHAPDIRMVDVFRDVWAARKFILFGAVCGLVCAVFLIWLAVPHFRAGMIVSPANPMTGAELSSMSADENLFALKYMVQRIGVAQSPDFVNFESIYAGPSVAAELLKDKAVLEGLSRKRAFVFSSGQARSWSPELLAEYVARHVDIAPFSAGPLRKMRYSHPDPAFATYFLSAIHATADRLIRERIRKESAERVRYLNEAIDGTMNPENRKTLTALLLEQERLLMLVSIDQPYAAAVIEPASSSSRPVWPDMPLALSGLGAVGAFLGFCVYAVRTAPARGIWRGDLQQAMAGKRRLNRWYEPEGVNSNRGPADTDTSHAAE